MNTRNDHGGGLNAEPETLVAAVRYFTGLDACYQFAVSIRWPEGIVCPRCGTMDSASFVKSRRIYNCLACKKQYSVKVGTIFEDSPLGLDKWFVALWMLVNCKNGVSSYEIMRGVGVTQKSAWFMLQRLRLAITSGSIEKSKLTGEVGADETFIGGKAMNMHKADREKKITGRGASGKAIVAGAIQRGETYTDAWGEEKKTASKVPAGVIPDTKAATLDSLVTERVAEGSALYMDAALGYRVLAGRYDHQYIDHVVTYVQVKISKNSMENFWSLLDRALHGTYVC